jgi:hypothetical protein
MAYTVVAIHQGSDSWARQVFAAVRARLKSGHLGSTSVRYTAHAPSAVDGPIAAVYLASPRAATDTVLLAEIGALQNLGVVVALGDLLAWIAADRGLSTTLTQAVTAALETP